MLSCMYALHIFLSWRKEMLSLEGVMESAFAFLPLLPEWVGESRAGEPAGGTADHHQ